MTRPSCRVPGLPHDFLLLRAIDVTPEEGPRRIAPARIRPWLRAFAATLPGGLLERRLLADACRDLLDLGAAEVARRSGSELRALIERALDQRRLAALVIERPRLAAPDRPREAAPPRPVAAPAPSEDKTWVEIALADGRGKAMSGERYRIELPDGTTKEGRLDGQGRAHHDGIERGDCRIRFPDLEPRA